MWWIGNIHKNQLTRPKDQWSVYLLHTPTSHWKVPPTRCIETLNTCTLNPPVYLCPIWKNNTNSDNGNCHGKCPKFAPFTPKLCQLVSWKSFTSRLLSLEPRSETTVWPEWSTSSTTNLPQKTSLRCKTSFNKNMPSLSVMLLTLECFCMVLLGMSPKTRFHRRLVPNFHEVETRSLRAMMLSLEHCWLHANTSVRTMEINFLQSI